MLDRIAEEEVKQGTAAFNPRAMTARFKQVRRHKLTDSLGDHRLHMWRKCHSKQVNQPQSASVKMKFRVMIY